MSASLNDLIPDFAGIAHEFVDQVGALRLQPRVTSTLRSRTQQEKLYREYLRGGRGYPVAPPGTSAHEYGFAFDMVVSPMDALADLGAYWQSIGGVWSPHDAIHFQYPGFNATTASTDSTGPNVLESTADTVMGFLPGIGSILSGFDLATIFSDSEIVDLLAHPSKAVRKYPWLAALGPPFSFYLSFEKATEAWNLFTNQ